jgi:hypothetical protein
MIGGSSMLIRAPILTVVKDNRLRLVLVITSLILISLLHLPVSIAFNLISFQTPSTGYQPQFQVFGDKIYYVWHEVENIESRLASPAVVTASELALHLCRVVG